ncbi:MAG: MBOAT family protein [Oscillospiraceae bacterium]|nr:MBOAT family protein [Oscillospiraceae bacterium]
MSICSIQFLLFTGLALLVYYLLPARLGKAQPYVLLAASLAFFLSLSPKAVCWLLLAALASFGFALLIERRPRRRKCWLVLDVLFVLGLLAALKYHTFFTDLLFGGAPSRLELLCARYLLLPIGVSFYSLAALGYVIDVYREKYKAERNFFRFLLFLVYFPHILQGPIARYDKFSPQLEQMHGFDWDGFNSGLRRMLWGYIKKMVIADRAAVFVGGVYAHAAAAGGTELFIASLLYTVQIYADFSGCVDIMCGISELFGIGLAPNFEQPYLSRSLGDFWRRWHISLSSWFRDYLYIPLGGNRRGRVRRYLNVLIVFLVSGFWHGAGWNFIVWGAIHGVWQILEELFYRNGLGRKPGEVSGRLAWLQTLVTFLVVNFAWIFFSNDSLRTGLKIVRNILLRPSLWVLGNGGLFSFGLKAPEMFLLVFFIALLIAVDVLNSRGIRGRDILARQPLPVRWLLLLLGVLAVFVFGVYGQSYNASSFIYMQF